VSVIPENVRTGWLVALGFIAVVLALGLVLP